MNAAYQLVGVAAIWIGLYGTWLAARRRRGWLLCIVSSLLWFPALATGGQWAGIGNCCLSIAVCVRNFRTQARASTQDVRSGAEDQRVLLDA